MVHVIKGELISFFDGGDGVDTAEFSHNIFRCIDDDVIKYIDVTVWGAGVVKLGSKVTQDLVIIEDEHI